VWSADGDNKFVELTGSDEALGGGKNTVCSAIEGCNDIEEFYGRVKRRGALRCEETGLFNGGRGEEAGVSDDGVVEVGALGKV
jgi:hypothetical protein